PANRNMRLPSALAVTDDCGVTTVCPRLKSPGCDTFRLSVMVTINEQSENAVGSTSTFPPMTTVPVRALTMTLAATAPVSTSSDSSCDMNAMRSPGGGETSMVTPSTARAWPGPNVRSIADTMCAAVVKSDWRRLSVTLPSEAAVATARSTIAPLGMLPPLGALTEMREPSLPDAPKPLTTRLPCATAYTCPSAPRSGAISNAPPRREPALPIDDTVTSMVWPGLAKAGNSAWIATAATFFSCGFTPGGIVTPSWSSIVLRLCTVNGVWLVRSPLPSKPTTRP